ncbi:hypothetical protein LCGC14_0695350 [marine sediment metagenome]|uniref:Uncharacterized protein n=1 Tax=marine sediment metagenome TaxID=412755 RepID=A0A0F9QP53_9ZZZZ
MRVLLHRHWPVMAWTLGAVIALWIAVGTLTADSHTVCTSGGRSQESLAGECYDWRSEAGGASLNERMADALLPVVIAAAFGYAAVKTWKRGRFV